MKSKKIKCYIRLPEEKATMEETAKLCAKIYLTLYRWNQQEENEDE